MIEMVSPLTMESEEEIRGASLMKGDVESGCAASGAVVHRKAGSLCRLLYCCDKLGLISGGWTSQPGFYGAQDRRVDRTSVFLRSARVSVL